MKPTKMLAALAALAALAGGGVALSGCGASATLDPLARAADVSSRQAGATVAMTMQLSAPGLPGGGSYTLTAEGAFDERARTGEMTMDMSQIPGISALGDGHIKMIMLYPVIYMNMPFLASKLPAGKTWMKVDLTKAAGAAGLDASSLSSLDQSDPTQFLQYLRASSGAVVQVGSGEVIDGVPTTHYSASIRLSRVLERLPSAQQGTAKALLERLGGNGTLPVQAWVDAQGRVRRMQMSLAISPGAGALGAGVSMAITVDFKSYGPVPPVTPPPASEVFDASALAGARLGHG